MEARGMSRKSEHFELPRLEKSSLTAEQFIKQPLSRSVPLFFLTLRLVTADVALPLLGPPYEKYYESSQ
jgi:hypothetical protein